MTVSPRHAKLVFALVLVVQCVLWSNSRYAQLHTPLVASSALVKRSFFSLDSGHDRIAEAPPDKCVPRALPPSEQCHHVKAVCSDSDTFLHIAYLRDYFCTAVPWRPAVFVGFVVWLGFLFSTLGITASDFFCPNLATVAQTLGLDENVAGVTFLAFGNGSPDVFATFSAMRDNAAGLAIGELVGAASFIVSVVVGSMCIIKPFKVDPFPFLRDVGFFTVAVGLLLATLWDGRLMGWEAGMLVLVYGIYVCFVVVGTWWMKRRERKRRREELVRNEYAEDEVPQIAYHDVQESYRDEPTPIPSPFLTPTPPSPSGRLRAQSQPQPRLSVQPDLPPRSRSRVNSQTSAPSTPHLGHMASFSLVGALEFRHLVNSLQPHASTSSLGVFDSPITPFAGGHYHRRTTSQSRTPLSINGNGQTDVERDPWDAALSNSIHLEHRSRTTSPILGVHRDGNGPVVTETPGNLSPIEEGQQQPPDGHRGRAALASAYHILFPTLHGFKTKSAAGKFMSVFATPAVLLLTLTLPVVVTPYEMAERHTPRTPSMMDGALFDFEEEGYERALIAEEEVQEEMHGLGFNKWLMAAQCVLGPIFCINVLFDGAAHERLLLLVFSLVGLLVGGLVVQFAGKDEHPTARFARCMMGFAMGIVWIMAIADEVVHVLQTIGHIFGLSNAIIGLTIFAMGNSVADLVANTSVAVFAPIMGFSACFGGPMLNILLGVGISGTYIIAQTQKPYDLDFSRTLLISSVGLLAILLTTMIVVPLNGYHLTRRWGMFLILFYTAIMSLNVFVEIRS